jgi:hypothetical protein
MSLIYELAIVLITKLFYYRDIYNGRPTSGFFLRRIITDIDPIESNGI